MRRTILIAVLAALTGGIASGGEFTKTQQSSRLYTAPDPSAGGGIRGKVTAPSQRMAGVFVVPQQDPSRVYRGEVAAKGNEFSFRGLPVGKYDLMVLYPNEFYEGMVLFRDKDSLTAKDLQMIERILAKSVPFFDTKKLHRCVGATGREGKARGVLQEVRTRPVTLQDATVHPEIQVRSIKLAFLEDVGTAGWQLVNTREIVRTEVGPEEVKGVLPHHYDVRLGGVRVTDGIKDIGELDLKQTQSGKSNGS